MRALKRLTIGPCPIEPCTNIIYNFDKDGRPVKLNRLGASLWVLFNDGSNAEFSVCKECLEKLALAELEHDVLTHLVNRQILTWGLEVIDVPLGAYSFGVQLHAHITKVVFLKAIAWAKDKDGLPAANNGS